MAPPTARQLLEKNRRDAYALAAKKGHEGTRELLEQAEGDLVRRLEAVEVYGAGAESFTAVQMRATLYQVRQVTQTLNGKMKVHIVGEAGGIAEEATGDVIEYLGRANKEFLGVGEQPLAINEAAMLDTTVQGVESSVLRRLGSTAATSEGVGAVTQLGILQRYGMEVVGAFERKLQLGLIAKKPWAEMRTDLVSESTFLRGAPASWAERIVRTELMGAYNRAGWETMRSANEELGDMCKILCATFDNRTAADSYAVHGQIRRTNEAFETWFGMMQHPPSRPNDREIVVPHRVSWPIPDELSWRSDGEINARWRQEKRRGSPPSRPKMTSIPLDQFGKDS